MFCNALNTVGAALSASAAFALLIASALSCSFLEIRSRPGELLVSLETQVDRISSNVGILCAGDEFYDLSDEPMRKLSWFFLAGASVTGAGSCLLAWAMLFGYSKPPFWQCISGLAAVSSLLQLPIFLLFEIEVCTDYTEDQECYLDFGSYLLIASTGCWVLTTLITQCTDPPGFLQHWRTTAPSKKSHIIPDVVIERWRPLPHSETQRSRSSESQRSRLSQQNAPHRIQSISTSSVQPSLVTRTVVDWDRASAVNHSLFDQMSVATSEMSNVNFYPAGKSTAEFSQLSFSNLKKPSAAKPHYAQFSVPTSERLPLTAEEPFEPSPSVLTDSSSSQFSDPPPAPSISTIRSRDDHQSVDTGLSSLEELIARAVRKSTRRRPIQSNDSTDNHGLEKRTRSTSPLTLGSLDTHDDAGDESIYETKQRDIPAFGNDVKEQNEYIQSDLRAKGAGERTTSLLHRSWDPTGMKYMRIRDDSDFKLNSPPLEIAVNMEESDDFILDRIGGKERLGRPNVITPDAKDIYTVSHSGRSASFGGERYYDSRRASTTSDKSDVGRWLAEMSVVNRQHAASSASIVSATSSRLGARFPESTLALAGTAKEIDNESFDPHVAPRPRQRALSTPNVYEVSPVLARRQAHDNRRELDRPPLMKTNLVPRKEEKCSLPPRDRGNEISALMSEEFSGHRVVSWGGSARTHVRSRSVPRGVIDKASQPLNGDAQSLGAGDNASVGHRTNSIFRQDRDKRAGIHAPAVITADSDDGGDDGSVVSSKSQLARKAREARLRRLATNRLSSKIGDEDKPVVPSNTQLAEKARQARAQRLKATLSSQSSVRSRLRNGVVVTVSENTPSKSNGYGYTKTMVAVISNSVEDSTLDTLDAHLAEVQRPVGAEYGSDEKSV